MRTSGTVYLVGAGPGDAGLLTLRGAELLRRADVVIYDVLVNPELLRLAPAGAQLVSRGKRASADALSQAELNELMIAKAREGKCVVRLKGGDPYVFGRGGEEAEALAAAGVPFEVVPGVPSFVAAPNYAGIPLTHRAHCSSFTVFTGHEGAEDAEGDLNFDEIARVPGTKVILMGLRRLRELTAAFLARGLPADTPVAVVASGTTGAQRSVAGTLANIAELAAEHHLRPPALVVIGTVVKLRPQLNWFERRPLFGQRIVVTRARAQAAELSQPLRERGAEVLEVPTIRIEPPDNKEDLKDALLGLHEYDWIVFTSPNGVTAFFDYFFKGFEDARDIGGVRIAAVGPATAAKVREYHLAVDLIPEEAVASRITEAFTKYMSIENLRILLLRAEVANRELPRRLEELGAIVDDIGCYKTVPEMEDFDGAGARLMEEGADWVTFTSGSTVRHFHARFDLAKLAGRFPRMRWASIGPETSRVLADLGFAPAVEAKEHTVPGLVAALEQAVQRR
jgi:uroporphyrinogen III methyltransferase/synthase